MTIQEGNQPPGTLPPTLPDLLGQAGARTVGTVYHGTWSEWVTPVLDMIDRDLLQQVQTPGVPNEIPMRELYDSVPEEGWKGARAWLRDLPVPASWSQAPPTVQTSCLRSAERMLECATEVTLPLITDGAKHVYDTTVDMVDHLSRQLGPDLLERWRTLSRTPFDELTPTMKQKDIDQAEKMFRAVGLLASNQ